MEEEGREEGIDGKSDDRTRKENEGASETLFSFFGSFGTNLVDNYKNYIGRTGVSGG